MRTGSLGVGNLFLFPGCGRRAWGCFFPGATWRHLGRLGDDEAVVFREDESAASLSRRNLGRRGQGAVESGKALNRKFSSLNPPPPTPLQHLRKGRKVSQPGSNLGN